MVAAVTVCSFAFGEQLTVSIDGFGDPSAFNITDQHLELRVSKLVPAAGTNTSTHILIEGLSPLEEGSMNFASTYSGIDVNTGEIQDSGVLYLQMPTGSELPAGTVASPIVGVVQRAGDWDSYTPVFPATDIGNPTGPADYDGATVTMTLTDGGSTFIGTTDYTVIDQDTLVLAPFTLTRDGVTSYNMSETTLFRDAERFFGTLTNLTVGAGYDSLIFSIELNSIPDADGDGIPDISDSGSIAALTVGAWNITDLGYIWGGSSTLGYSPFLGWIELSAYPAIYNFNLEWMIVVSTPTAPDTSYWLYSPTQGWIYAESVWGGGFLHNSGSGWMANNFHIPNS